MTSFTLPMKCMHNVWLDESCAECKALVAARRQPVARATDTAFDSVARGSSNYGRASAPQVDYVKGLMEKRDLIDTKFADWSDQVLHNLTSNEASKAIDELKLLPYAKSARKTTGSIVELEDGMYRKDGKILKVYHTVRGANQQVAKELVDVAPAGVEQPEWEFMYRGKAPLHGLTANDAMTLEEAKEFGTLYGICCVCGATLTDETSIANGIGPICGGKF